MLQLSVTIKVPCWLGFKRVRGICNISDNIAITKFEDKKITRQLYEAEHRINPSKIGWDEEKQAMVQYYPNTPASKIIETITKELETAGASYETKDA